MIVNGKKILIVGLGKSGLAARDLLKQMGADVILYDSNKELDTSGYDDEIYLGDIPGSFASLDGAVFSPGVPLDTDIAMFLKEKGVEIIGEIELASYAEKGDIIAITGTNGKTTTTTLTGEIMRAYKKGSLVVGNIGYPYTEKVTESREDTVTVAEISSFQLETIDSFHPKVTSILNITPDHLNRHHTMDAYIQAKLSITKNQTKDDLCVLNFEDKALREAASKLPCKVVYFSSKRKLSEGLYQDEDKNIVDASDNTILMNMKECMLPGDHNAENIMAAILMTSYMGVPMDMIIDTIKAFTPVPHRVEYVDTIDGVMYYNDSKATNTDAAIKGICSMDRPTILIGGGYDKNSTYGEWIRAFNGRVKKLLLLGQTKENIAKDAKKEGFYDFEYAADLREAIDKARKLATEGDAVLLSPACASWDMFDSYEQRGDLFKEYVRKLH